MNIALIVSGGIGRRFDAPLPKQYQLIGGRRVIDFVIDSANKSKLTDTAVVAAHKEYEGMIRTEYNAEWAEAGLERNQTIRNGLEYIKKNYSCRNIIILDAVRPFVKSGIIDHYFNLLEKYQAVATARKITDSLGCYDLHQVDRERYYLLSSPEAFNFDLLYTHMDGSSKTTELIQHLPETTNVFLYFEYFNNMKITYKEDLRLAEMILHETV
jgi:2-C-methyl-D-erythritol 4-phosphate cytidylyltransferase/2-C-methyl-D-erythritol 2,4-cyclodiphosphate synthase